MSQNHYDDDITTFPSDSTISTSIYQIIVMRRGGNVTETTPSWTGNKWLVFFLLFLVFAGMTGNLLVCIAVSVERKLQNVTNYFLVSLAMADLFVSMIVMPCCIVQEFMGYWPFGLAFCGIWQVSDVMMCTSSIMHMCTISMDRYMGIKDPLKTRNRSRIIVCIKIFVVWFLSLTIASPLIFLGIYRPDEILGPDLQCAILNEHFLVYGSLAAFFLPLLVMLITYSLTIRLLSKRARQLERRSTDGMRRSLSTRKRDRKLHQTDQTEVSIRSCGTTSSGMVTIGESGSTEEGDRPQTGTGNESEVPYRRLYLNVDNMAGDDICVGKTPGSCLSRNSRKALPNNCLVQSNDASATDDQDETVKVETNDKKTNIPKRSINDVKQTKIRLQDQSDIELPESEPDADRLLLEKNHLVIRRTSRQFWTTKEETRPHVVISNPEGRCITSLIGNKEKVNERELGLSITGSDVSTVSGASSGSSVRSKFQVFVDQNSTAFRIAGIFLGSKSREDKESRTSLNTVKTEQKAVKVLGTMFFLFVACWLSFFTVNLSMGLCSDCNFHQTMFKCFLWLGYSSSTLNPIIYTVFNKAFKNTFIRLLTCMPCRECSNKGPYRIRIGRFGHCEGSMEGRSKSLGWPKTAMLVETRL